MVNLDAREHRHDVHRHDVIEHPSHYNWHPYGIECKDVAGGFDYNLGVAIAYVWRAGFRDSPREKRIEDLRKARKHLEFEIERLTVGANP